MSAPESPTHGLRFDLAALAQELRAEPSYAREGHTARTLVRTSDLRVVLVVLRAGKKLLEHHVNVTASVYAITGNLRLQLADHNAALAAGQLFVLAPGLAHDVYAETDSTFMLTLGWQPGQP
jgi:quercetin dioxygenase-like cupin family protein